MKTIPIVRTGCALLLALAVSGCGGGGSGAAGGGKDLGVKAQQAYDLGDLNSALVYVKNAVAKDPSSGQFRLLMGRILLQSGNVAGAVIELRKAQEANYTPDEVAPLLARCLLAQQAYQQLITDYANVKLADAGRHADLSALVASAYAATQQSDKANALVDATLATMPDNLLALQVKASLLGAQGDMKGALQRVERALTLNPKEGSAWRLKGDLLLYGQHDPQQALTAYRKATEARSDDLVAHAAIVSILLADKNLDGAKEEVATVAKVAPNRAETTFLTAKVALASGEFQRARDLLAPLVQASQDDPNVLLLAAAADLKLNALVSAQSHLEKLLVNRPQTPEARIMMATIAVRRGDSKRALDQLQSFLGTGVSKPNLQALALAAEAQVLSGNTREAAALFTRINQIDPNDVKARIALALTRLAKGERAAALTQLQTIAASDTGVMADIALINARSTGRDVDGALQAIDVLEKKLPGKALPADLRARAYLQKSDMLKARQSFEQALARDPIYFPSVIGLAQLDVADGRSDQAMARLETLLKSDPKNARALVVLAGMRRARNAPSNEVGQLLTRAVEAQPNDSSVRAMLINYWVDTGNIKRALEAAQASQAVDPDSPEILQATGRAQLTQGQAKPALITFGRLAALQPQSAPAQLNLAQAYLADGDPSSELRAIQAALELGPDLPGAQQQLIRWALREKQAAPAVRAARAVQQRYPTNSVGYLIEGDVYAALKDWAAALKAYRVGLQQPHAGMAAVRVYAALVAAGQRTEADRFAADWLKKYPNYVLLRRHLADEALRAGELGVAEALYREVVAVAPRDLGSVNNLAWILTKTKKPEAVTVAQRAVAIAPDDPNALDTLASAMAVDNKLGPAIDASKAAVRLAPEAPQYRLNLAKIYLQANDKPAAKAMLDELVKLGPSFSGQPEVQRLLATL